jgi:hypothetical protein
MARIFGSEPDAECAPLASLASSLLNGEPDQKAIACNLIHDHRVSGKRAVAFCKLAKSDIEAGNLQSALEEYQNIVRKKPRVTFLSSSKNSNNFAYRFGRAVNPVAPDYPLFTVLDLSGLTWVLIDGRISGIARLREFGLAGAVTDEQMNRFLEKELGIGDAGRERDAVATVLEALKVSRTKMQRHHHPVWAASSQPFLERADRSRPDSWLEAVGVNPGSKPRWLIVLKYAARDARSLVRPTVLDAGWYAFHFPSPPAAPLRAGGHAMWLREAGDLARGGDSPMPEFIHSQVNFKLSHWEESGFRAGFTSGSRDWPVASSRRRHLESLRAYYGAARLGGWMEECLTP